MKHIKKVWSSICQAWDDYTSSGWLFILTMPIIIGIGVAVLVHIGQVRYDNSINNPENDEFVIEVAFNLSIEVDEVTQKQFNARYQ